MVNPEWIPHIDEPEINPFLEGDRLLETKWFLSLNEVSRNFGI
jgi:hypothetical protein